MERINVLIIQIKQIKDYKDIKFIEDKACLYICHDYDLADLLMKSIW